MRSQSGFSVTELLVAVVVAGILATVAIPAFSGPGIDCDDPNARPGPLMRARIADVTGDLGEIHIALARFELANNRYPSNLAEMGLEGRVDPWGNPYQYLIVLGREDIGPVRKDNNLQPVNTNYDLYSMGPNGRTESPLNSNLGQDDIVLANDGGYLGPACRYTGSGM